MSYSGADFYKLINRSRNSFFLEIPVFFGSTVLSELREVANFNSGPPILFIKLGADSMKSRNSIQSQSAYILGLWLIVVQATEQKCLAEALVRIQLFLVYLTFLILQL